MLIRCNAWIIQNELPITNAHKITRQSLFRRTRRMEKRRDDLRTRGRILRNEPVEFPLSCEETGINAGFSDMQDKYTYPALGNSEWRRKYIMKKRITAAIVVAVLAGMYQAGCNDDKDE